MNIRFFITDVFSEKPLEGNQLATFLDFGRLDGRQMQKIAKETNFSETTFITSRQEDRGGYDVRIFTPGEEIPFAGHPTLGTAYLIREKLIKRKVERVVLNLKVGQIPVTFPKEPGMAWMKQRPPEFGKRFEPNEVAGMLGLRERDIDDRWPSEIVSTGLPFVIVPLRSLDVLRKIKIDETALRSMISGGEPFIPLAFVPEGQEPGQDFSVRVFPVLEGIAEDPATGSGNGCLAAYLVKNRYQGSPGFETKVGQGYEIGRPSTLYLKAAESAGEIVVNVGGKVSEVAAGYWKV
ncbi:MAG TPA: PhzF family phenazine biosynthesis protein [Methanomassiliicoccales archaeon]